MKGLPLLLTSLSLVACDRPNESETPAARPAASAPSAPAAAPAPDQAAPAAIEEPPLTPQIKPAVIDLGGVQAGKAEGCALTVRFGSIGTGTDNTAKRRIGELLENDPSVSQVERFIVGREGETFLCVRVNADADTDQLFDLLRAAAADAYMVAIRSDSGRQFDSPRRRL